MPGAIDVTYQARVGTLRTLPLPNDTSLATLGVNFADTNLTVRFLDGQQSVTIAAPIIVVRSHMNTWFPIYRVPRLIISFNELYCS